ncbi:Sterile alpha motif domain-containing protein 9-like protein [Aphelenchoides fujianensis]|nr:Sterile alpha motif domain-containing protein 9-like protein [Aphelenchoides fujianensis]
MADSLALAPPNPAPTQPTPNGHSLDSPSPPPALDEEAAEEPKRPGDERKDEEEEVETARASPQLIAPPISPFDCATAVDGECVKPIRTPTPADDERELRIDESAAEEPAEPMDVVKTDESPPEAKPEEEKPDKKKPEESKEEAAEVPKKATPPPEEPKAAAPEPPADSSELSERAASASPPPPLLQRAEEPAEAMDVDKPVEKSADEKDGEKIEKADGKKAAASPTDDDEAAPILRPEVAAPAAEPAETPADGEKPEQTPAIPRPSPPAAKSEEASVPKTPHVIWSPVSNLNDATPPTLSGAVASSSSTTTPSAPLPVGSSPLAAILKTTPAIGPAAAPAAPKKRAPRPKKTAAAKKAEQQQQAAAPAPMVVPPNMMYHPQFIHNGNGALYALPPNVQFLRPAGPSAVPPAFRCQPTGHMSNGNFYLLQNPPASTAQPAAGGEPPQLVASSSASANSPVGANGAAKGGAKAKNAAADGPPPIQRMQPVANPFPYMLAPNATWRQPTAVNQNGQFIITTPTSGYYKPAPTGAPSGAGTSKAGASTSTATSTAPTAGSMYTRAQITLPNGETQYVQMLLNPTTQQDGRPIYRMVAGVDGTQQLRPPPNLQTNLADCPPPPTLSPNPSTSGLPPPTSSGGRSPKGKKRKNDSNGAPSLTAELPAGRGDEPMDVDGDDDKPPKIEREDTHERNGANGVSRQKSQAAFAKIAQSQQPKGGAPRIVQHFLDGHVIEEEVGPQPTRSNGSSANGPPTKQRKLAQPPFSVASKSNGEEAAGEVAQIAQRQVNWVAQKPPPAATNGAKPSAKSQQSTSGAANRAIFVQNQAPVFRPANYQPELPPASANVKKEPQSPTKTSTKSPPSAVGARDHSKSLVGRPPITKPAAPTTASTPVTTASGGVMRQRGRPRKSPKNPADAETPSSARPAKIQPASAPRRTADDAEVPEKRVKSAGNTPAADSAHKTRKNREIEGLLTMDFGPGKTPFKTTNPDLFTENILTSQQRIQSHVRDSDDGRTSRASVASSASHSRNAASGSRRSMRQESVSVSRPRRVVQQNGAYTKLLDDGLESEEDEDDRPDDRFDEEFVKEERPPSSQPAAPQSRTPPVNRCMNCGKSPTSESLPQYCSKECQHKFKKRQRVELFSKRLQSGGGSRSSSSLNDSNGRQSLDLSNGNAAAAPPTGSPPTPTAAGAKIRSPNGGGDTTRPSANNSGDELETLRSIGIQQWNSQQTARWAELVSGSVEAGKKFLEEEIDGDVLLQLTEEQLKSSLGLKLGPQVKILRDLNQMKKNLLTA